MSRRSENGTTAHSRVNGNPSAGPRFRGDERIVRVPAMASFMSHVAVPIAIGAVALVLLLGLANMMRGGSGNTSQKLMRLRVLLQFVAIIVIMATLWIMQK
jgi:Hypoxia induced protein conserved region